MPTTRDARLDVLLDAICALAETLPPDARRVAGVVLTRLATCREVDDAADEAVAADLARLLVALDCLPGAVPVSRPAV